jgi:hypothetical protein
VEWKIGMDFPLEINWNWKNKTCPLLATVSQQLVVAQLSFNKLLCEFE